MTVNSTGYFRPGDAPEAVGISRSTIYLWKSKGLIKSHKVGRMTFFKISDVKAVIEGSLGDQVGDEAAAS